MKIRAPKANKNTRQLSLDLNAAARFIVFVAERKTRAAIHRVAINSAAIRRQVVCVFRAAAGGELHVVVIGFWRVTH